MKRVSKAQWLETALSVLQAEGVDGVRVERIARKLGISKSGFYWHFENRDDLHEQMLAYWAEEFTAVVRARVGRLGGSARDRLRAVAEMILEHDLARYDLAMWAWAQSDPAVAKRVRAVYRRRVEFIGGLFRELGFEGDELEMRTRLFVVYHSWERLASAGQPKKALRALIDRRLDLLTRR
jgi:AcrR family transcriptional regulator